MVQRRIPSELAEAARQTLGHVHGRQLRRPRPRARARPILGGTPAPLADLQRGEIELRMRRRVVQNGHVGDAAGQQFAGHYSGRSGQVGRDGRRGGGGHPGQCPGRRRLGVVGLYDAGEFVGDAALSFTGHCGVRSRHDGGAGHLVAAGPAALEGNYECAQYIVLGTCGGQTGSVCGVYHPLEWTV